MNKFLTKIAKAFVGLSMAIGVGVAVGAGRKEAGSVSAATDTTTYELVTSVDGLETGKSYVIASTNNGSGYAMSNADQSNYRELTEITVSNNKFTANSDVLSESSRSLKQIVLLYSLEINFVTVQECSK